MGLTVGDIKELTWFFNAAAEGLYAPYVKAQSYLPGGGGYDPYTDDTLTTLVLCARRANASDWARIKRTLDHLADRPRGRAYVEVLRLVCRPNWDDVPVGEFRWPEVAARTPAAVERGRELAIESNRRRALEAAFAAALASGCSPMAVAMRVLETERLLFVRGLRVRDREILEHANGAVAHAKKPHDASFIAAVKKQMSAMVSEAGDAYRAARDELGATRRSEKARRRREAAESLDEALGRRRRKEFARYAAKRPDLFTGPLPEAFAAFAREHGL